MIDNITPVLNCMFKLSKAEVNMLMSSKPILNLKHLSSLAKKFPNYFMTVLDACVDSVIEKGFSKMFS